MLGKKWRMIANAFQPRVIDNIHRDELRAEWQNIQFSIKWFIFADNFCQWCSLFPPCLDFEYWYTVCCCGWSWNSKEYIIYVTHSLDTQHNIAGRNTQRFEIHWILESQTGSTTAPPTILKIWWWSVSVKTCNVMYRRF